MVTKLVVHVQVHQLPNVPGCDTTTDTILVTAVREILNI